MAEVNDDLEKKLSDININSENGSHSNAIDGGPVGKVAVTGEVYKNNLIQSLTASHDENYCSNYEEQGYCVIFNHKSFARSLDMSERSGTDKDRDRAAELFKSLGFRVAIYNDLKEKDLMEKLFYYSIMDHSTFNCFVLFFMSHGEDGLLYAYDKMFKAEVLFSHFTADNCSTLAGKPKLFFIQACRGDGLDHGTQVYHKSASRDQPDHGMLTMYKIPNHADFLVSWSTVSGYYSWRNTTNGSWFIQSLVVVFRQHAATMDVLSMMTNVNRFMILNFESNCPSSFKMHKKKQSACIMSTLMRRAYITPQK